jgi:tRNA nucleotidyltransferase (CCA-adding enzyme)
MTKEVIAVHEDLSLLEASKLLEESDHSAMPVLNGLGELTGFISLRDIMKGRKAGAMKAPVRAYMTKPAISAGPLVTMREVERIFYKYHIGHLPIVEEQRLVGIVSRRDYLAYKKQRIPD